jgi:hypothetical protein
MRFLFISIKMKAAMLAQLGLQMVNIVLRNYQHSVS